MKTRIDIDDALIGEAMEIVATKSKKETIELALKELIALKKKRPTQQISVKPSWDSNLAENKLDWFR